MEGRELPNPPVEMTKQLSFNKQEMELDSKVEDDRLMDLHSPKVAVPAVGPPTAPSSVLQNEDKFDNNAWFVATRHAREHLASKEDNSTEMPAVEDSMPILTKRGLSRRLSSVRKHSFLGNAATVSLNQRGNVFVSWLDPDHEDDWVPVCDVMNIGTYCVQDTTPLSKAYRLFTELGLRHIVVLGGESGGEVVGILTRMNFRSEFVSQRTECANLLDPRGLLNETDTAEEDDNSSNVFPTPSS